MINKSLNFGRKKILSFIEHYAQDKNKLSILDIGTGSGSDLLMIQDALSDKEILSYGIDSCEEYINICMSKNINCKKCDIEFERIPFSDNSFDVVILNQVMEHTKQIFHIINEIHRILKIGGNFIIGVPNLASLHNRILLLFGRQPSCIQLLSGHIRGFTYYETKKLIEYDSYFKLKLFAGSNFYPFPSSLAVILSNIFPKYSVGLFFSFEKTNRMGKYSDLLNKNKFDTPYLK